MSPREHLRDALYFLGIMYLAALCVWLLILNA